MQTRKPVSWENRLRDSWQTGAYNRNASGGVATEGVRSTSTRNSHRAKPGNSDQREPH